MLETRQYARKQFEVEAVQVNERNMNDVAAWCGGSIHTDDKKKRYIKLKMANKNVPDRQTTAYVGDWVLSAKFGGFKIYLDKAFKNSFEEASAGSTLHDVSALSS